jgi:four helix bundle protein
MNKEFIEFLRIAKGLNGELRTKIHSAAGVNILGSETGNQLVSKNWIVSSMLQNLIKTQIEKFG